MITRVVTGLWGGRRNGSFAGREEVIVIPPVEEVTGSGGSNQRYPLKTKKKLVKAEEVIKKIKKAAKEKLPETEKKAEAVEIFKQSTEVIEEIKHEIKLLEIKAAEAQIKHKLTEEMKARLSITSLKSKIEEIDTVFVMFMMIANID